MIHVFIFWKGRIFRPFLVILNLAPFFVPDTDNISFPRLPRSPFVCSLVESQLIGSLFVHLHVVIRNWNNFV